MAGCSSEHHVDWVGYHMGDCSGCPFLAKTFGVTGGRFRLSQEFERGDGCGFVEAGFVHLRGDGVAGEQFGRYARKHEHAGRVGREPRLFMMR